MSNREFTLAALVPDPITIRIGDVVLAAKSIDQLSPVEVVEFEWLHTDFTSIQAQIADPAMQEQDGDDDETREHKRNQRRAIVQKTVARIDQMLRVLIPDITDTQLRDEVTFARKIGFIQWWQEQAQETQSGGGTPRRGKPARPTPARSSPASVTPTN